MKYIERKILNKKRPTFFNLKKIKVAQDDFFTPDENLVFVELDSFLSCQNVYEISDDAICDFLLNNLKENEQSGRGQQTILLLKELKNIFFNSGDIDVFNGYSNFGIEYFKMKIAKERIEKTKQSNGRTIN